MKKAKKVTENKEPETENWKLSLYVLSETPESIRTIGNLKRICEEHLSGKYSVEVVDLKKKPQAAKENQIVAVPTLIKQLPPPLRKIVGDLSNTERVLVGLGLSPAEQLCKGVSPK